MTCVSRHFVTLLLLCNVSSLYDNRCYTSIISFGASVVDTGNLKELAKISNRQFPVLLPPYGQSFPNHQTGRCSNGRLIIDFLAESLGLPLVPPFVHDNKSDHALVFVQGVNYAVAGATALNSSFLAARGITNASLEVQSEWFKRSISSILAMHQELIEMGARTLVVPGNFPVGCLSAYLTICGSEKEEYDPETGCLVRLNEFAEYHNELLQTRLNQIRQLHPNVNVIYADYYNAAMKIYRSPDKFGFTNGALKACCGGGGPYNINLLAICGDESSTVCDQPDTYVGWDGIHLTEAAYKIISMNLYHGPYTTPEFNSLCPTSTFQLEGGISSFI